MPSVIIIIILSSWFLSVLIRNIILGLYAVGLTFVGYITYQVALIICVGITIALQAGI